MGLGVEALCRGDIMTEAQTTRPRMMVTQEDEVPAGGWCFFQAPQVHAGHTCHDVSVFPFITAFSSEGIPPPRDTWQYWGILIY